MNSTISAAIGTRSLLRFSYDGGVRTLEPHCYGVSTAGHEVLRGYQTAGQSTSGNPVGWKMFDVSKMSGVEQTNETFSGPRPGYKPNDKAMTTIFEQL